MDLLYFQWVDHFLRDVENGVEKGAPVEYFTIGEDKWKTAENWPVAAARPQTLYLDGEAGAAVENHGPVSYTHLYQFSPAAFFEGLSAWNEAFAEGGSPVSCGGSRTKYPWENAPRAGRKIHPDGGRSASRRS